MRNRSLFKPMAKGTYKIKAKENEATVYIYDEISWWGVDAETFVKDLNDIDAGTINLHINSPGGSVFDGVTIYNAIKQHKSKVVAHIDGLAASIASVIVMAADEIRIGENAFLMIHEPWSIVVGGAEDMRKEAALLDKVSQTIVNTYMKKSTKSEEDIKAMMAEETWMTAKEALDVGFVDHIDTDETDEQAKVTFDLSAFANVPDSLKENRAMPTAREIERILRDAGCSNKQAKAILSDGYTDDLRDEDSPVEPKNEGELRDVVPPAKKDRVADLLTRAEVAAPSTN